MFRFILLLLLERCGSSSIHSVHAEDEALGPVMRRESLKAENFFAKSQEGGSTSTVQALNPLDPDSLERPYRESVSIHLAQTTGSTTTSSTTSSTEGSTTSTTVDIEQLAEKAEEAAEAAAKASEEAQWRARLSTVKDEETETGEEAAKVAEPATDSAAPFATQAPFTAAGPNSSGATSPQAAPSPTTTQYSRKYITTSRRTMTIQVTTDTTSMGSVPQSTLSPATSTIPLKIPAHMHPVLAPGSNFPEELSAASWQSLQARSSSTTSPAMPVEASVDAAAKVAQQAATRAGASEEDAAVAAAKAAAWMMKHELSMGRQTSHTSSTTMSSTSSWVRYVTNVPSKVDATQKQMENAYTAAAESVKNKYATSQIPFASNRTIKVMKEVNLTGRPMRVRVITSDGDVVPTEAPEDDEDASTSELRDPASGKLQEMREMIDEVVLKDLPKIVAAVAAKISHRPFQSEIPKAASRMVVKLLTETPVRDVPDAILQMLMELAARERPTVQEPLPLVQSALGQILDDYRAPEKDSITKVVDQAMDSAHDLEEAADAKKAEPQSEKVLRVITDTADRLAGSSDDSEDVDNVDNVDISTTGSEEEETAEASSASASDGAESETETETEEDSNSSNVTADGKAITSAEVLPDEDQPYTAAEMMKSAKEHKGTAIPSAASGSNQRPIAVHSVHAPVKAVSPGSDKHAGDDGDDHDEEEELEVESPAKSGGKVLVGLTIFLGSLLMVVAITSAGYMAYQRSQEQRPPGDAAPAQAPASPPATGSRASGASGAAPDAAPTFTGGPGGPEAGA